LRRFVGFFRRFKTGKHMQHEKNAKSVRRQNKNAASNNSWKGNNLAYVGRRRYIYIYTYIYAINPTPIWSSDLWFPH
jgi:hypothetical protein